MSKRIKYESLLAGQRRSFVFKTTEAGASAERLFIIRMLRLASGSLTHYYMGNYEEEIRNGNTRKIHYISGGNGLAAVYVQNSGQDTLYYAHTDFQGSLVALTLSDGTVKERYAYDPWGNRRNPTNWTQRDTRTAFIFNRGYTLHEHLPEFSLINMNGRVYDPLTSIFFSPYPYLQAPGNWLNYNRYTYCLNNPLRYTDPDGEFIFTLICIFVPCMQPFLPIAIAADAAWMSNYASQVVNNFAQGYKWNDALFKRVDWFDVGFNGLGGAISSICPPAAPWIKYAEPWVTNAVDIYGNGDVVTIFGSNRNNPTKDFGMYLGDSFLETGSILVTDALQWGADNN